MKSQQARIEVVIVAEDEADIRSLVVESLAGKGFEVLEADCAAGALAILESRAGAVQLLFTDIHMPGGMDGFLPRISETPPLAEGFAADRFRQRTPGV